MCQCTCLAQSTNRTCDAADMCASGNLDCKFRVLREAREKALKSAEFRTSFTHITRFGDPCYPAALQKLISMARKRVAGGGGEAEPKRTRSNRDAAEHDNKPGPGSLVKASDDARPDALEALELQQAADASKAGAPASVGDAAPQRGPDTPVADEEVPVRRSAAHARARR